MHGYVAVRGRPQEIEDWAYFLKHQYLPFEVLENGQKEPTKYLAQLQVREFRLFEIVFPKDCEDMAMCLISPNELWGDGKRFARPINWLRKILGLKKCSTNWKPNSSTPTQGMQIYAIGTKDDKLNWEVKKDTSNNVFDLGLPKENL